MRVCFVGDIVGGAGRRAFKTVMPGFLRDNQIDCCIVNAENSVHGLGASINILRELENSGADLFTMGNHTFSNRDFLSQISKVGNVARPANFSPSWPGNDFCVFEKNGVVPVGSEYLFDYFKMHREHIGHKYRVFRAHFLCE